MKQAIAFILAALFSLPLLADSQGASADAALTDKRLTDNQKASALCLAALDSRAAVKARAQALGVSNRQLQQVSCTLAREECSARGGSRRGACALSLAEFARLHSGPFRARAIATVQ